MPDDNNDKQVMNDEIESNTTAAENNDTQDKSKPVIQKDDYAMD